MLTATIDTPKATREQRIEIMANRVAAGLHALEITHTEPAPVNDDDDDTNELSSDPEEEWNQFFGGITPTARMEAEQDDETPHVYG